MDSRHLTRACGAALLSFLFALSLGCGPDFKSRGVVKGKVTFGGKNLTAGNIMFHRADKVTSSGTIDKDGNYVMNDAPVGDVKITIVVPKMPPGGLGKAKGGLLLHKPKEVGGDPETGKKIVMGGGDIPTNLVPIPDKYGNLETTDLTYTVTKGEQTHDIALKP